MAVPGGRHWPELPTSEQLLSVARSVDYPLVNQVGELSGLEQAKEYV